MEEIKFSTTFFGTTGDDFLGSNITLTLNDKEVLITTEKKIIKLETNILPDEEEIYFFFSINEKEIFRLRLYLDGKIITGDIRKRLGFQVYELYYLIESKKEIKKIHLNVQNLNEYEEYWKELKSEF